MIIGKDARVAHYRERLRFWKTDRKTALRERNVDHVATCDAQISYFRNALADEQRP